MQAEALHDGCRHCGAEATRVARIDGTGKRGTWWCFPCNRVAYGGDSYFRPAEGELDTLPVVDGHDPLLTPLTDASFDELAVQANAALAAEAKRWVPPSIDDKVNWGKHKGMTYRQLAASHPGYARWAASTIPGLRGQLCAEALAAHLGVS